MTENGLSKKIDDISVLLYQNQEKEAMEEMPALIREIQEMAQRIRKKCQDVPEAFVVSTIRELVESYKMRDMLAMADCLQQKALLMVELEENI